MTRFQQRLSPALTRRLYYIVFLLLAALTLSTILYAAKVLWSYPYAGMTWSPRNGQVSDVDRAGLAYRAGIRPGDRVLAIDGIPLAQIPDLYVHKEPGDVVVFTLRRDGREFTARLTLTTPTWSELALRLEPLFIALIFWGTATLVWMFQPAHRVTRLFFLTSQTTAAVLAVGDLGTVRFYWTTPAFRLLLLAVAPLTLHFFTLFPQELSSRVRRALLFPAYGGAGILALLTLLFDPFSFASPVGQFRRAFIAITLLVALAILLRGGRVSSRQVQRRRRLLIAGITVGLLPLLLLSFLPDVLAAKPLVGYLWTFPLLAFIPVTYAYAMRAGELGAVDWVLSRSLVHLVLTGLFFTLYVLLFWSLDHILAPAARGRPFIAAALAVAVAALFAPLRHRLLRWADRLFYGGWYEYRSLLGEMTRALASTTEAEELADLLVARLSHILHLRGAALFLTTDAEHLTLVRATGWEPVPPFPATLPLNGALAQALGRGARPITTAQLLLALDAKPLCEEERAWLLRSDLALWVPLVRRGDLQGLLLLGRRTTDEPFDGEDLHLLATLASAAAIAAQNARLFLDLRRRAEEVNQLYAQLAQAREEERKHVARELHDRVIQDLINVYHYLDEEGPRLAPTPREHTEVVRTKVLSLVNTLRDICSELRPPALDDLDIGLVVQRYVEDVQEETGLPISLHLPENRYEALGGLPEAVSLALFRTLQEALTNVRRHARATQVHVSLTVNGRDVVLVVEDNGQGFDCPSRLADLIHRGHYGLAGMQERLALIGGTLHVTSVPCQGTVLRACVPRDGRPDKGR